MLNAITDNLEALSDQTRDDVRRGRAPSDAYLRCGLNDILSRLHELRRHVERSGIDE